MEASSLIRLSPSARFWGLAFAALVLALAIVTGAGVSPTSAAQKSTAPTTGVDDGDSCATCAACNKSTKAGCGSNKMCTAYCNAACTSCLIHSETIQFSKTQLAARFAELEKNYNAMASAAASADPVRWRELVGVHDQLKRDLDSLSQTDETESLRLQAAMDRMSKMEVVLSSDVKKKADETAAGVIQNMK